ncbi:hypothetical protein T08_10861 [Trichinella sp. T8]|nr:hypothetical protein T08_10861 [Trichinella sp. T8]
MVRSKHEKREQLACENRQTDTTAEVIFLNDLISYIKNGMQSCFFNCIESPLNYVLSSVMFISLINK